jgi:hypothetical protein
MLEPDRQEMLEERDRQGYLKQPQQPGEVEFWEAQVIWPDE